MNFGLDSLVDGKRIVAIDVGPVPFPSHALHPGEHLFANCHYGSSMADVSLADMFHIARNDALEILRRLASTSAIQMYVGLVACIYGHFPVAGAERPARRRIYDIGVLCRNLLRHDGPLTLDSFAGIYAIENSQLTDIAELRHQFKSASKN
jgi:hypothetical protein